MNYLAHIFLSCEDENLIVGNILGDILKNKEMDELHPKYSQGVKLHRKIDSYTDSHPVHLENLKFLYPTQGKYASVVMDIFYDYFLGKNWSLFTSTTQRDFCDNIYNIMINHAPSLPEKGKIFFPRMVHDDFLYSCHTPERMETTFVRILRRVNFRNNIHLAVRDLIDLEEKMEPYFLQFFPEVHQTILCGKLLK